MSADVRRSQMRYSEQASEGEILKLSRPVARIDDQIESPPFSGSIFHTSTRFL